MSRRFAFNLAGWVALGALAAGLGGCASPAHLELSATTANDEVATPPADALVVRVEPLADARLDPDAIGQIGGRPLVAEEVAGWVEDEFNAAVARRHRIATDRDTPVATVRPTLRKLYGNGHMTTKMAVVVLEVEWAPTQGGAGWTKLYRGQKAGINWSGGEGELEAVVRAAMTDCLGKLDADLRAEHAASGDI